MKFIEDWHVVHYESGIVNLLINTTERWIDFFQINDFLYRIGGDSDIGYPELEEYLLKIPEDKMILEPGISYLPTVLQNKDQIGFYFIPFSLVTKEKNSNKICKHVIAENSL